MLAPAGHRGWGPGLGWAFALARGHREAYVCPPKTSHADFVLFIYF